MQLNVFLKIHFVSTQRFGFHWKIGLSGWSLLAHAGTDSFDAIAHRYPRLSREKGRELPIQVCERLLPLHHPQYCVL
ncbi:hypothetical protein [Coleofasciculus sp. FACHB-129]|uniref:hypothetical protein n=1 Tax=Cyanophyceae TaxID=3028117 RepID=UPI001685FAB1|nr:hypothetical protein [Coleofasciculus sp. FACHB-129]MBD1896916.1 hypothetical protein [Coleofasciculus sp. FACHB-129]